MKENQMRIGIYCKGNKFESITEQKTNCFEKCEDLGFSHEDIYIYEEIDETTVRKANQFLRNSGLNYRLGPYDRLRNLISDIITGNVNVVITSHEDVTLCSFSNLFKKYNVKYICLGLEMDIKLMNREHLAIFEPMISKIMTAKN